MQNAVENTWALARSNRFKAPNVVDGCLTNLVCFHQGHSASPYPARTASIIFLILAAGGLQASRTIDFNSQHRMNELRSRE
jgi:hypothetical protein